jgi:hypothetical protein
VAGDRSRKAQRQEKQERYPMPAEASRSPRSCKVKLLPSLFAPALRVLRGLRSAFPLPHLNVQHVFDDVPFPG